MKKLRMLLTLCIMLVTFFSSETVYCKTIDNSDVNPEHPMYCPYSASGYHEGSASDMFCVFYDDTVFPQQKNLVRGCPPGYVKETCRVCGQVVYYSPDFDLSIDDSVVYYRKDGLVYYACVDPSRIYSGHLEWLFGY